MAKQIPTREDIIKAWKKADAESDKPVGATQVAVAMGISPFWIWKLFAGKSLTDMKRQHGIRLSPPEIHRSEDELLLELDREAGNSEIHRTPGAGLLPGRGDSREPLECAPFDCGSNIQVPSTINNEAHPRVALPFKQLRWFRAYLS